MRRGYNDDVTHAGRAFNVQTEDAGVDDAHIVSRICSDDGSVLKTKRSSYAQHVGKPNVDSLVGLMLRRQHQAMLNALLTGRFG